jgi:imidazolonepropionase-like amidohydrolase
MVDLHSHVLAGGFAPDTNEMILPVNPELRASSWLVPGNRDVDRARAAGVTTLFGIPGSGTSIGGFGVVYKTVSSPRYREAVVRDPGGMKVAQSHNPQRRGGDLGASWSGLCWILEDVNDRAREALAEGRFDPALENLKKIHAGELPVLIHCAGSDGVANAVRMWKHGYDTRCVVSHGCWDAYKIAPYVVGSGVPVNHGPRNMDWFFTRDSKFVGTADEYLDQGAELLSLNTDSPIVPQEELFLQGSVGAHLGADSYQMMRALTAHPAQSFGLGERVGSLEPGKDADVVVFDGDPLDPRSSALVVVIDGRVEYDRARDGRAF